MTRFFVLLMLATLTSCGNSSDSFGPSKPAVPDMIGAQLCTRLTLCFAADYTNCAVRIGQAANVSTGLGLNASSYPHLTSVNVAVANGQLQLNESLRNTCRAAILNASCSNPVVQSAYTNARPYDFESAANLLSLDSACSSFVFP